MSFAFTIGEEEYDRDSRTRIIKKINRLYDVSAVTYAQTTINARSYFEAEAEKERLEKRERERDIEMLILKLKL